MKFIILLSLAAAFLATTTNAANLVCYYDSASYTREGLGKLLNPDLEIALQFCTHLIYGYAGIKPDTYQAYSLNENLDIYKHQYSEVTALKRKYPHLKILLSVGGDKDIDPAHPDKYIELLEGEKVKQTSFINSAYSLVRSYGFDGLDLAYQFPKNKPRKVHTEIGTAWKKFKKLFTGDFIVDPKADQHKEEFTAFVRDIKNALRPDGLMLTLTVLPNVNSSCLSKISLPDVDIALQFCTHLVYGYVGIRPDTFQLMSINENLDIQRRHFAEITALKQKYPNVKFLLSVGGDKDVDNNNPEKYVNLLESGRLRQNAFIESARTFLRNYNFDGLDLAFQLPRNKPRKVHSDIGMAWKSFKKFFTGDYVVDKNANDHREQFTDLVTDLRSALRTDDFMLTLTVLPNVNASWYYDTAAIINNLDFVNLATFDFVTPERNPEEADYTAPLYELNDENRLGYHNINYQVEHWLLQRAPANKINIGVPTFGRAWKLTTDSGTSGRPIVAATAGAAPPGPQTRTPGFLNWAEVCARLPNPGNLNARGANAPLRRISDPSKRYGTYAFYPADENGDHGIWVSYEDPDTAANKAGYVKAKNLGGVALFDLANDDFRGQCTGDKYPMLRAVKYRLL